MTGNAFPNFVEPNSGDWVTTLDGDWCGGHWVGLLRMSAAPAESEETMYQLRDTVTDNGLIWTNYYVSKTVTGLLEA
ncbi:hypothetical protein AUR65_016765 [Haloferax marisrubri]|uniref:Uncharacterized protein n=2 Tax=Haloferax marisrubri TaxID=1544719 RepID=A0A2P4NMD9_9EURY|nr:hypothetical protein AUR65_016765 [Haloferax marisrubri]